MSLSIVEEYLAFAGEVIASRKGLPTDIDALELENVLVSHGVVLLYARMEQCFQEAIECKCNRCMDNEVRAFALSVKNEKTGKISFDSVKGTVKRFGIDHSTALSPELERLSVSDSWNSVVNIRQRVAHHGERASLTFAELRGYYSDIRKVLGCICKALTLEESDVSRICCLIEYPSKT
jgi:hypothetical protein